MSIMLVALVVSFPMLATPYASAASSAEYVVNPEFAEGTLGWRTNSPNENLSVLDGNIAQLSTHERGHAVLNDQRNTIVDASGRAHYTVAARVRTTTPNVAGAVRVREVAGREVRVSQTPFTLRDTAWRTVTLKVTTEFAGSHLDLNVVAWNLDPEKNLQIDSVSLRESPAASLPNDDGSVAVNCTHPPPTGTIYGSSISTRGQTLEQALQRTDETFGPVEVIRHFRPGLPLSWDSYNMKLMVDRTLITSFKVHPSEILSGQLDSFFLDWFAAAPTNQTIYWSYFHEPEDNISRGEFTSSDYRAAWAHLARLERQACKPNLHATLILTEWTMRPTSNRDYRIYDAGPDNVKVLAFDPYNGASDPTRDYYKSAEDLLGNIVRQVEADGRPWGIAELGSHQIPSDSDGSGRAKWLSSVADYAEKHEALFLAYYHSVDGSDFRLLEPKANAVWRDLVAK